MFGGERWDFPADDIFTKNLGIKMGDARHKNGRRKYKNGRCET